MATKAKAAKSTTPAGGINFFTKAVDKTVAEPKKKAAKGQVWTLGEPGSPSDPEDVRKAVEEIVDLDGEIAALTTRSNQAKGIVKEFADDMLVTHYAKTGMSPDTPISIAVPGGKSVTYVVQDRAGNTNLDAERIAAIQDVLGEDGAKALLHEQTVFSFNPETLTPEVMGPVSEAFSQALAKLVTGGILTEEAAGNMIECKVVTRVHTGIVKNLAVYAGRDKNRLRELISAVGSVISRYVKA